MGDIKYKNMNKQLKLFKEEELPIWVNDHLVDPKTQVAKLKNVFKNEK